MRDQPTLRNLTASDYSLPAAKQNELLQRLGTPHIESFNYMLNEGINEAVENLLPVVFDLKNGNRVTLKIENVLIASPSVPMDAVGVSGRKVYPTECRQRAATYRGKMTVRVDWSIAGGAHSYFSKDLGDIPIMLKSNRCHLEKMSPAELVAHNEHEDEWGGYFIVKGHEKLVRMLIMTKRNYPLTIRRSTWQQRGKGFSDLGIQIRCVRNDESSVNNTLHFLTDGSMKFMFSHNKKLYYVPVIAILKCLLDCSDQYIFKRIMAGIEDDTYVARCVENMLRAIHCDLNIHSHEDCKAYIGRMFRVKLPEVPSWTSDIEVTDYIIKHTILIHVDNLEDKFNLLCFMIKKLFNFTQQKCISEGADSIMMQETLTGGQLMLKVLKEKLQGWLTKLKFAVMKRSKNSAAYVLNQTEMLAAAKQSGTIQSLIETFLATGNVPATQSNLGLMQETGLTILVENISRMRYMSHFRAIHRGAFFTEMRTTEARQLLPEAWGFICPVHTPDGAPCGLLNHLTLNCQITVAPDAKKRLNIAPLLTGLGMISWKSAVIPKLNECYTVMLDGKILGYIHKSIIGRLVDKLRMEKIKGETIPNTTEIALVPMRSATAQYPGLFLFTGPGRMMRPCVHLASKKIELVGTFEQVYMDICVSPEEAHSGVTTHMELSKTSFLSNLAQLIPMPDCNQSPRNMYQCQMGKQTMGTPCHTWGVQAETKLYRLETPASPLFRPVHYDNINLDDFPMGTNAVVAVIAYTGYDMEDAMIINKSSFERGFGHGCIYKSKHIELDKPGSYFCRDPQKTDLENHLDTDGLPHPGMRLKKGDPFYCYFNPNEHKYMVTNYGEQENITIDNVRMCGAFSATAPRKACITYRVARNPMVGDKWASRAGQKGICSKLYPTEDLPFTETGLVPDIIFNPHGFPSRMTIAMMIEIMAGKSAATHGMVHDATPFRFDEEDTAIGYFGELLKAAGYNYYGEEPMYSGVDGREMKSHIFFGIVHYQRLRHMVSDKWQARRTGTMSALTKQPIGGRKRGGGIRLGEMERDALISHGAAFFLQDRLLHCSDKHTQHVCATCGTLLGPISVVTRRADDPNLSEVRAICRQCGDKAEIYLIEMPYIFKYMVTELASININIKLALKHILK